jgi:hypothetical protein
MIPPEVEMLMMKGQLMEKEDGMFQTQPLIFLDMYIAM